MELGTDVACLEVKDPVYSVSMLHAVSQIHPQSGSRGPFRKLVHILQGRIQNEDRAPPDFSTSDSFTVWELLTGEYLNRRQAGVWLGQVVIQINCMVHGKGP